MANFDYTICKLCNKGGNSIQYRLRNANVVVCQHCGFHYTDYKDEEYSNISAHSDKKELDPKTVEYIQQKLQSNPNRFAHHIKTVLQYKSNAGEKLLDIGFGGAVFLQQMQQHQYNTYGIELDSQYILYAKQVLQLQQVYDKPLQDAFWQQQYAAFFKVIVLWDVLEHVNDPLGILQSAAHLLQKGGYLFIDTPCRDGFYHRFGSLVSKVTGGKKHSFLHSMYSSHRFGHKQILSKADMQWAATKAGLQVENLQLFHELSFPYTFYLRKMIHNETLVRLLVPIVKAFFTVFPLKNKMMVVLKK